MLGTAKLADAPFQRDLTKYGLTISPTKKTKISQVMILKIERQNVKIITGLR